MHQLSVRLYKCMMWLSPDPHASRLGELRQTNFSCEISTHIFGDRGFSNQENLC